MQQLEIKKALRIHLSDKQIRNYSTSNNRLKKGSYCPKFNAYLKRANECLIHQLAELINENYIELDKIKELGLFDTIRIDCLDYRISYPVFESRVIINYKTKEQVINNMLYAINLIDFCISNNTLKQ